MSLFNSEIIRPMPEPVVLQVPLQLIQLLLKQILEPEADRSLLIWKAVAPMTAGVSELLEPGYTRAEEDNVKKNNYTIS